MDGSQRAPIDPRRILPARLQSVLQAPSPALPAHTAEHAAVLLCWVAGDEPYTLLTQRSRHLKQHAGQISLPGGRIDRDDDSLETTALREAHEEIGLDPALPQALGRLPDTTVGSGIVITPVVAWCGREPAMLQHNPQEVERIIRLPLRLALKLGNYGIDSLERDGLRREFHFLCYQDHYIWGATARILLSLAQLVDDKLN